MKIILAKTAGFCMGVKRALDIALKSAENHDGHVFTHGPLIHNPQAVRMLEERGVKPADDLDGVEGGCVVIRAHGIPLDETEKLRARGFEIVDATCPHVRRSQKTVRRYSSEGWRVIIVGDRDHAEIAGIEGYCEGPYAVISTEAEAREVEMGRRTVVIAQTTFSEETYERIAAILKGRDRKVVVENSICRATQKRQAEAAELGTRCEAVIVVGGRHSANTRRLVEIASQTGTPTFHVETADELDIDALKKFNTLGVTAGASTPSWITQGVIRRLEFAGVTPGMRLLARVLSATVKSNLYSSLAAIALTFAACVMQGITFDARFLIISFCYIFATSMLNRLFEEHEDKLHIPGRVRFYRRHSNKLLAVSLLLIAVSLGVSLTLHHAAIITPFLVAAYGLGMTYSLKWIPWGVLGRRIRRLKDITGSKDIFAAIGWTAVAVYVPFFNQARADFTRATLIVTLVAFFAVVVKSILVDFTDMYSDRRLGRETLPIALGERGTHLLLFALVVLTAAMLGVAAYWPVFGGGMTAKYADLGFYLLLSPALFAASILLVRRRVMNSEVAGILIADGNLILLGFICAVYGYFA